MPLFANDTPIDLIIHGEGENSADASRLEEENKAVALFNVALFKVSFLHEIVNSITSAIKATLSLIFLIGGISFGFNF